MIKFSDLKKAFDFVGSDSYGMHTVILNKQTGEMYWRSEMDDMDEITDADIDGDQCIEIPHKNDLDLGRELVFDFVPKHLPEEYDRVLGYFQGPGAYRLSKELLERRGLLKQRFEFENENEEKALREWCAVYEIKISG
jgi:hypothetical protein